MAELRAHSAVVDMDEAVVEEEITSIDLGDGRPSRSRID
jgi:hypothetical protein